MSDPSRVPLVEMMAAAWVSLKEELASDGVRWTGLVQSPAAQASPAAGESARRAIADEALALIVRSMMESALRSHGAVAARVLPGQMVEQIAREITGFAVAVAENREAICTSESCDWRGSVRDMGPVALCVKCGAGAKPVTKLQLVNGAGARL